MRILTKKKKKEIQIIFFLFLFDEEMHLRMVRAVSLETTVLFDF